MSQKDMDEESTAVTSEATEAAETTAEVESAPTEETTNSPDVASEKTETTQQEEGDEQVEKGEYIPKQRFDEVYARMKQAEQAQRLLEGLKKSPELASEFLRQATGGEVQSMDPQIQRADQTLRELGYVKATEAAAMVQNAVAMELSKRDFIAQMEGFAKKYDGSDGGPKFDPEEIARYMDDTGISNPEKAYREKYLEQLADKTAKERKRGVFAEKGGQPRSTAGEDENALIKEAQKTGDWTKIIRSRISK